MAPPIPAHSRATPRNTATRACAPLNPRVIDLTTTQDQIDAAYDKIDEVAGKIGAVGLPPGQGGKLENFLRLYCPNVVSALVAGGIWPSK